MWTVLPKFCSLLRISLGIYHTKTLETNQAGTVCWPRFLSFSLQKIRTKFRFLLIVKVTALLFSYSANVIIIFLSMNIKCGCFDFLFKTVVYWFYLNVTWEFVYISWIKCRIYSLLTELFNKNPTVISISRTDISFLHCFIQWGIKSKLCNRTNFVYLPINCHCLRVYNLNSTHYKRVM